MSLKPIRAYFKERLKQTDSNFKEHTDAFNTENIGSSRFDKAFHIFYGELRGSALTHLTTEDVVITEVSLFMKGFRDPQVALDDGFDIANKFRLLSMRPEYANTNTFIKGVVLDSIRAEPIDGNDNAIIFRCSFSVTVVYGTSQDLDC